MNAHLLRLDAIIEEFTDILSPVFGKTAGKEVRGIIADYLDVAQSKIRFRSDQITITLGQKYEMADRIERRAKREPAQYLSGSAYFMDEKYLVGQGVLIPRSDTEILVKQAIGKTMETFNNKTDMKPVFNFLEFCTGSGCISLSFVKKMLSEGVDIHGIATDVSPTALTYAIKNIESLELSSRIKLICHDIMSEPQISMSTSAPYDMILANPPYIRTDIIPGLDPEVSRYEPRLALDGGNDGLSFYRRIIECSETLLAQGGWLIMEIGYDQEIDVRELLDGSNAYDEIEVIKDYNGNPRVASGKKRHGM